MTHVLRPRDVDLLQAAFHAHPDATAAWQRWRDGVDWDGPIEPVEFSLLPRVCRNLESVGGDDPLFPRFKGIARQAWVTNQQLKASIGEWISDLPAVDFMALPPTSALFTDSTTVRLHGRWCHLAVHPRQAASAVHALLRRGWTISRLRLPSGLVEGYVLGAGHIALERGADDTLTLTWRLDPWFGEYGDEVWAASECVVVGGRSIRSLCRTDAMLFVLRQPVGGGPLRWVSNVLALSAPMIDWARVRRTLASRPLGDDCLELLPTLCRFLDGGNSPASSWQWPVAATDRVSAPPPRRTSWRRVQQHWATYTAAWGGEYRLSRALAQLPGYLMGRWRMTSLGGLLQGLARWL